MQTYVGLPLVDLERVRCEILQLEGVKEKLLADLDEFLAPETQKWYKDVR